MTAHDTAFDRARRSIPGGVNSPVRAFAGVGGTPRFMRSGRGARLTDIEGREYLDYVASWGPLILGHADPRVVEAVQRAAADGLSFGAPTQAESELAELLCERVPGMQQVRLVNSGTEATMSALRLARGATGRELIVKFEGCYHGHSDSLLVKAGSGALTLGVPSSPGVPEALAAHTLTLPFNDSDAATALFAERGADIAALIVEPVAGNMGCVPPRPGFLQTLRRLCDAAGTVLIFDEVMTGFRVGPAGAQGRYGVQADLVTLGKVIGGGMPVGAFGGRADLMAELAPLGPVYQAGTLSGNPLATAAGLATLRACDEPDFYPDLELRTAGLAQRLALAAHQAGVGCYSVSVGGMFGLFFSPGGAPVGDFAAVSACDTARYGRFFHGMLERGHYFAPSAFEAGFVSAAHTEANIDATVEAAAEVFATLA